MNPPYHMGGKIWDEVRKLSKDIICLMPLAQYKANERYKYINYFEVVNNMLFDAAISGNLCITTNQSIDNGKNYEDFLFDSFNQNYRAFYEWNKINYKGLFFMDKRYKPYTDFDIDLDFIETNRLCFPEEEISSSGFSKNGCGYKFNILKRGYKERWLKAIKVVHWNTKKEKDNFSKWWYSAPKGKSLSSMVMIGLNIVTATNLTKFAVPQIDWEKISDHPLWKEGKYDEAVLDTMGLRQEGERIVEI